MEWSVLHSIPVYNNMILVLCLLTLLYAFSSVFVYRDIWKRIPITFSLSTGFKLVIGALVIAILPIFLVNGISLTSILIIYGGNIPYLVMMGAIRAGKIPGLMGLKGIF